MIGLTLLVLLFSFGSAQAELIWSTYLGGNENDGVSAVTTDGEGGIVIVGDSYSQNFPTTEGAFDPSINGDASNVYVACLSPDGHELRYSTFLGIGYGMGAISDGEGGVFITGASTAAGFPTTEGAYDVTYNGGSNDVFLTRLNHDGSELIFSTHLGGGEDEYARSIASDGEGGVILTGNTFSSNFTVTDGAYDENFGGGLYADAFIARFNSAGNQLIYSTFLGGRFDDRAHAITSDGEGGAVVAGYTFSSDFPTTDGAYDRHFEGEANADHDAFIARINHNGSALIFSSYLGGSESEWIIGITTDDAGDFVATGETRTQDFPVTENSFDGALGGDADAFVTRLSRDGSALLYSTYLGGRNYEQANGIASDGTGGVVVTGWTESDDFPTVQGSFDTIWGTGFDLFLVRLNEAGDRLLYGSFLGGEGHESGNAVNQLDDQNYIVAGGSSGANYPVTEGALDESFNGRSDGVITKIDLTLPPLTWVEKPDTVFVNEADRVLFNLTGTSLTGFEQLHISYGSDNISEAAEFTDHQDGSGTFNWLTTFDDAGEYLATFALSDGENEISAEVVIIVLNVNREPIWVDVPQDYQTNEGMEIDFEVVAMDPDSDLVVLTCFVRGHPDGWAFSDYRDGTGRFRWQTGFEDAGVWTLVMSVSDGMRRIPIDIPITIDDVVSVANPTSSVPSDYFLADAFPNPFNSTTTIRFGLPVAGEAAISIYDLSGQKIATLSQGRREAGYHQVKWNAGTLPGGTYLVKLKASGVELAQKVVVAR